ncbi:unnamed protein product [Prorocentrum cordatum]|uniref:Translation initiation factor IF-3 n=1 Tax=Prorocentrum cordatum TaxID=2364126 RepID=A0ABN9WBR9_9DINO|nr:unnamed protein product [Polarella glacialis]
MARRAVRAGLCASLLSVPSLLSFVPGVRPHIRGGLLARRAESVTKEIVVNERIPSAEVRIIGMWNDETKEMEDANDVMPLSTALQLAKQMQMDVLCTNTNADPPLVKIMDEKRYLIMEKREAKVRERAAQAPKVKEVKLTYNIGDGDIQTKIRSIRQWLAKDSRQQVKVRMMMKGRTRMFEAQARDVLTRFREDLAQEAKVPGVDRGVPWVTKDGRGDLTMMLGKGPDPTILKKLKEEGRLPTPSQSAPSEVMAAAGADATEEASKASKASTASTEPKEVQEILDEIQEMREELLECGIDPGQIDAEEEMKELQKRLTTARSKIAARALGAGAARARRGPPALALAGSCAAFAVLLRPRRR